jgi:hypothetical protein
MRFVDDRPVAPSDNPRYRGAPPAIALARDVKMMASWLASRATGGRRRMALEMLREMTPRARAMAREKTAMELRFQFLRRSRIMGRV